MDWQIRRSKKLPAGSLKRRSPVTGLKPRWLRLSQKNYLEGDKAPEKRGDFCSLRRAVPIRTDSRNLLSSRLGLTLSPDGMSGKILRCSGAGLIPTLPTGPPATDSAITHWVIFSNSTLSASRELRRWTQSENRWMRRAAAVSLIIPAKHGTFLPESMEIANLLLTDSDDMVQKGYGWLLKEASRQHQAEVFAFVMRNRQVMPRTALRYTMELMPKNLKEEAMEKKQEKKRETLREKSNR